MEREKSFVVWGNVFFVVVEIPETRFKRDEINRIIEVRTICPYRFHSFRSFSSHVQPTRKSGLPILSSFV